MSKQSHDQGWKKRQAREREQAAADARGIEEHRTKKGNR